MKRIIILAGLVFWSITQYSCINSLNPLVTFKDVVQEKRIIGNWDYKDETFKIEPLAESRIAREFEAGIFERDTAQGRNVLSGKDKEDSTYYSKAYLITYSRSQVLYVFVAALTKINGYYFMDLHPMGMEDSLSAGSGVDGYGVEYFPAFKMARLDIAQDGKGMTLRFVDADFVKNQIESGNLRMRYEKDKLTGSFLITASTTELQQFMKKYCNDSRLFPEKESIKLSKQ